MDLDRNLKRFLKRLAPEEPLFPYGDDFIPGYSDTIPDSMRCWCYLSLALHVITLLIGLIFLRHLVHVIALVIIFLIFTLLGPGNYLLNWSSQAKNMNRLIDMMNSRPLPLAFPSMLWGWIAQLVLLSLGFVIVTAGFVIAQPPIGF
jgi:hypothetical protein